MASVKRNGGGGMTSVKRNGGVGWDGAGGRRLWDGTAGGGGGGGGGGPETARSPARRPSSSVGRGSSRRSARARLTRSPSGGATARPAGGSWRTSRSSASPPSGRSSCRAPAVRWARCGRAGRGPSRTRWGSSAGSSRTARWRRTTRCTPGSARGPSSSSSSSPPSSRRASARSSRTDLKTASSSRRKRQVYRAP